MDRMKTFIKYILWIAGFWILSGFLIEVGLNSSYKQMQYQGEMPTQIQIYQAESTLVNGRIKGNIKNDSSNNLSGKYIKLDLYSKNGNKIGCRYIDIGTIENNEIKPIEIYFKIKNAKSYTLSIVDTKEAENESTNIELLGKEFTLSQVVLGTAVAMLIIW